MVKNFNVVQAMKAQKGSWDKSLLFFLNLGTRLRWAVKASMCLSWKLKNKLFYFTEKL